VHQQVGNLLELGLVGEIQDVVAAVVQVVAAAADGAKGGISRRESMRTVASSPMSMPRSRLTSSSGRAMCLALGRFG
jgi:hypothetical protein